MLDKAFWRGKRVFVTGHTGFKGAWLVLWLRELGADVTGYALEAATPSLWAHLSSPCESVTGDIRDRDRLSAELQRVKPDIVLHLAAQALVHESYRDPAVTFETNVIGCVNLFEAARACEAVRLIINVTSDKCYENVEQIWSYRESDPMGGGDPYSASKGCAELVTAAWRRSYFNTTEGPVLASARAGNVIGGGDWAENRLIPDTIRAYQAGAALQIRNPLATRPWQHVLEPLSGYLLLAERLWTGGQALAEGWNFGPSDQDAWTVGQIADLATSLWGGAARWETDPTSHPHEAHSLKVDAMKARLRLGWSPQLGVEEAVAWTIRWYKEAASANIEATTIAQIRQYESLS